MGEKFGNELPGRSQVVMTEISDAIEQILPSLMKIFTASGDFVRFGDFDYEIVELSEPKLLFGQTDKSFEISATCILAREGKFNP